MGSLQAAAKTVPGLRLKLERSLIELEKLGEKAEEAADWTSYDAGPVIDRALAAGLMVPDGILMPRMRPVTAKELALMRKIVARDNGRVGGLSTSVAKLAAARRNLVKIAERRAARKKQATRPAGQEAT